jgi:outer membrane lipoprotein-sorting protein
VAAWLIGAAAPTTPAEVAAGVRETYQALTDLSADFSQSTTVPGFASTLQSKGKLYLAKGKMRWDYTEPSNQQIYVNERRIQYFIPAHKQVIVSTLSPENDDQIPLHLLMTLERLTKTSPWPGKTRRRRAGTESTDYGSCPNSRWWTWST